MQTMMQNVGFSTEQWSQTHSVHVSLTIIHTQFGQLDVRSPEISYKMIIDDLTKLSWLLDYCSATPLKNGLQC